MKTIENNKIIAEFLSVKIHPCETIENFKFLPIEERGLYNGYFIDELKYHEDWNWLMKVLEKIESLSHEQKVINWSRQNKNIFDFKLTESKIEAVYNACIDFINFYNYQNKDS